MEELCLELRKPLTEVFLAGSSVNGNVVCTPLKDEAIKNLNVECIGTLDIGFWKDGKERDIAKYRTFYWSSCLTTSEKGQLTKLKGGSATKFPFSFTLPTHCLPSTEWTLNDTSSEVLFVKTELKICYKIQVSLKREWPKSDQSVSTSISVKNENGALEGQSSSCGDSKLELSQDKESDLYLEEENGLKKSKKKGKEIVSISNFYNHKLNRGSIRSQVVLEKSTYTYGDVVQLSVKTYNQSAAPIRLEVVLNQHLTFHNLLMEGERTDKSESKVKVVEVKKWKMPSVQPWEIREWQKVQGCIIPQSPPSSCGISYTIDINPIVENVASQGWVSKGGLDERKLKCDLFFSFPLTILDKTQMDNQTKTPSLIPFGEYSSEIPSAPSLPLQQVAEIVTPVHNSQNISSQAPPSYDEAMVTTSKAGRN